MKREMKGEIEKEVIDMILEAKRTDYTIKVNDGLLKRLYGSSEEY